MTSSLRSEWQERLSLRNKEIITCNTKYATRIRVLERDKSLLQESLLDQETRLIHVQLENQELQLRIQQLEQETSRYSPILQEFYMIVRELVKDVQNQCRLMRHVHEKLTQSHLNRMNTLLNSLANVDLNVSEKNETIKAETYGWVSEEDMDLETLSDDDDATVPKGTRDEQNPKTPVPIHPLMVPENPLAGLTIHHKSVTESKIPSLLTIHKRKSKPMEGKKISRPPPVVTRKKNLLPIDASVTDLLHSSESDTGRISPLDTIFESIHHVQDNEDDDKMVIPPPGKDDKESVSQLEHLENIRKSARKRDSIKYTLPSLRQKLRKEDEFTISEKDPYGVVKTPHGKGK